MKLGWRIDPVNFWCSSVEMRSWIEFWIGWGLCSTECFTDPALTHWITFRNVSASPSLQLPWLEQCEYKKSADRSERLATLPPPFTHSHTLIHWWHTWVTRSIFTSDCGCLTLKTTTPKIPHFFRTTSNDAFGTAYCGFHVAYWNKCNTEAHSGFMQREQWVLTVLQYKGYFWVHLCESLWDCISSVGFFFGAALSVSWSYITGNVILRALKSYNFNAAYFTT